MERNKRFRCGPLSSTSDSNGKDSSPTLGHSEVLGVEYPERDGSPRANNHTCVRPALLSDWNEGGSTSSHSAQDTTEGVVVGVEDATDVFPDDDCRFFSSIKSKIVDCIA